MTIEGRRAFVFTDGCFLGLQVLGDETEPCFEGAAFFSLYKSLSEIIEKLDTYEKNLNNPESNEGGYKMPTINFRLSDDDKGCKLFDLLNPNYNEEGSWDLDCIIQDVYDDYAVVWNIKEQCHERVYYSKDDEAEEVTLGEKVKCFIVDVTEDEKKALKTIQALNGGTYEKIDENFGLVAEFNEKIAEDGQKIEELNASISTLESERNESIEQFEKANEQIEALTTEVAALNEYKLQVETSEKEAVINKYSKRVNEEVLDSYREKIAEFTAVELDKELAFELVNTNPSIFELDSRSEDIIPKNTPAKSAMETLLDRYEK
jgi:vacuolar-type H+-ATPase subunit I/STV1